jgi:hypothetical protein
MFRRVLLGAPLNASAVAHERMRKSVALPILSSDALSLVAYGPEAMLAVLALAGSGALGVSLRLSAAIVVWMIAAGLWLPAGHQGVSARRRLARRGRQELGEVPALIAAAGLMTDYVLTVAVSIAPGTAAVTSAFRSSRMPPFC